MLSLARIATEFITISPSLYQLANGLIGRAFCWPLQQCMQMLGLPL
jgi:hypothetical protein